jgi:hypothetical protein
MFAASISDGSCIGFKAYSVPVYHQPRNRLRFLKMHRNFIETIPAKLSQKCDFARKERANRRIIAKILTPRSFLGPLEGFIAASAIQFNIMAWGIPLPFHSVSETRALRRRNVLNPYRPEYVRRCAGLCPKKELTQRISIGYNW